MSPKDYTYKNQESWITELCEVKDVLDAAGVRYWLDTGTLLGAVRNGKFILYDDDMDLSALVSEAPKILSLIPQFRKLGYRIDVTDTAIYLGAAGRAPISITFYRRTGDQIWIIWDTKYPKFNRVLKHLRRVAEKIIYRDYHQGLPAIETLGYVMIPRFLHWVIRRAVFKICTALGEENSALVLPKRLVENLQTLRFYEKEFKIPHPPQEYLSLIYGSSWETPTTNWTWDDVEAIDYSFLRHNDRSKYSLFSNDLPTGLLKKKGLVSDLGSAAEKLNWWNAQASRIWSNRIKKFIRSPWLYMLYQFSKARPIAIVARTLWGDKMKCYLPDYFYLSLYGVLGDISEISLSKFIVNNLDSSSIFFDVGASCGFYSLLANFLLGDDGQVHSFEPTPWVFRLLKQNTAQLQKVTVNQCAISDGNKSAWLRSDPVLAVTNTLLSDAESSQNRIPVRTLTLDDYCQRHNIYPTFIKIDVEGAEDKVVGGAQRILCSTSPTVAMEVFRDDNDAHLKAIKILLNLGYLSHRIDSNGDLELINITPEGIKEIIPKNKRFVNLIFKKMS